MVLPTVLVIVVESEVMVVKTASVETGDEVAPVPETSLYKVVLPMVLVIVVESEVMVVKTASVE